MTHLSQCVYSIAVLQPMPTSGLKKCLLEKCLSEISLGARSMVSRRTCMLKSFSILARPTNWSWKRVFWRLWNNLLGSKKWIHRWNDFKRFDKTFARIRIFAIGPTTGPTVFSGEYIFCDKSLNTHLTSANISTGKGNRTQAIRPLRYHWCPIWHNLITRAINVRPYWGFCCSF